MEQPELKFFDLGNLVVELNSRLVDGQGRLELGDFVGKVPKKNPFAYGPGKTERDFVGKYPLFLVYDDKKGEDVPGSARLPFFDREKIGYVFVEEGYVHDENPFGGTIYETLRMRVKQPLKFAEGLVLPNSSIKIYRENDERGIGPGWETRRDHIRRMHIWWERTDLSSTLPTEWFYKEALRTNAQSNR